MAAREVLVTPAPLAYDPARNRDIGAIRRFARWPLPPSKSPANTQEADRIYDGPQVEL